MPRYRVNLTEERKFVQDIEADTPAEAAVKLGDLVRARLIEPIVAGISEVNTIRLREPAEP